MTHTTSPTGYIRNIAIPHWYCGAASAGSFNWISKSSVNKVWDAASGAVLVVTRVWRSLLSREHLEEAVAAACLC
jgi:hypothetical protein